MRSQRVNRIIWLIRLVLVYKREDDLQTTKAHFDRRMKTYRGGVVVLNLIKQVDKTKKKEIESSRLMKLTMPTLGWLVGWLYSLFLRNGRFQLAVLNKLWSN